MLFSPPKSTTITRGHASSTSAAFIVQLVDEGGVATLEAPTAADAVDLASAYHGCQGPLRDGWYPCKEGWAMDLYDWRECLGPDDPPPIAHITAPPGFLPPPDAPLQQMEHEQKFTVVDGC